MKIFARVKPNSKENRIEKQDGNNFALWVKPPAKENLANEAVVKLLSEYFDLAKSRIKIIKGLNSKSKIIEIL